MKILNNGYELIQQKNNIVLAQKEFSDGRKEFVTWILNDRNDTVFGHYYMDFFDAVKGFEKRSRKEDNSLENSYRLIFDIAIESNYNDITDVSNKLLETLKDFDDVSVINNIVEN